MIESLRAVWGRSSMMKRSLLLSLAFGAAFVLTPMRHVAGQTLSPELRKLNVSVGHWVFHGKTLKTKSGKPGSFTWNEVCSWSPNHLYLECTFSNVWSGKAVESLVVDTYNTADHNYWHYELYASGEKGDKPFLSRMDVNGNTWIEYGEQAVPGKKAGERIVYKWQLPNRVSVAIETSKDGAHWETVNQGEGVKQP
jgi:hypothetical protein